MSSIIFKNERVKKSEWYAWFLNKWIEAGWTNISSNPSTDGDVMYSEGINGNKSLYIGFEGDIKKYPNSPSSQSMDIRHGRTYTPNNIYGISGKWEYTASNYGYTRILLCGDIDPDNMNHELNMWYYVTKNWGMFITDGHMVKGGRPCCFFVGAPEIELGPSDKTAIIVGATKAFNASGTSMTIEYDTMWYTGNPFSVPTGGINLTRYVAWKDYSIASGNGNTAKQNTQFCSTIVYGTDSIGYKYQLDDSILAAPYGNTAMTMNYNVNGQVYKFFNMATPRANYTNTFYNICVGVRIK